MNQPRPIDRLPPEGSPNVLFQSFRTGHAVRDLMVEATTGTGVTGDEYAVLGAIQFFPDHTPTKVATALGIPPTTMSRYVNRFVEAGLVKRVANPDDGRSYLLRPTRKGSRIVMRIAPRVKLLVDELSGVAEQPLEEIMKALIVLEEAARSVLGAREVASTR
jgi:DNA-binding MarR family transcriptional regulator